MSRNIDQHRVVVEEGTDGFATSERVRSDDVMPTVDCIWSYCRLGSFLAAV